VLVPRTGETRGLLAVNPLAHPRVSVVSLADWEHVPAADGQKIKAVQPDRRQAVVEIPGSSFVWIPEPAETSQPPTPRFPLVEELTLRNEFFEVLINETTGGIQHLKNHGRSPNRLSQQLSYRFPRERTLPLPGDPPRELKTCYADVRMTALEITSNGPALGEIVTQTEVFDQLTGEVLAECRQTVQVWRGLPEVRVRIELDTKIEPDGDPWNTYFTSRFAWKDEDAALTRGLMQGAHPIRGERIEAPYYLEIASGERRTTLLFGGLPFHRRIGDRMLDSILVPPGETTRTIEFRIAVDEPYPLLAAHAMLMPPGELHLTQGPPQPTGGWFFHLKERNVQILSIQPLVPDPLGTAAVGTDGEHEPGTAPSAEPETRSGYALRLLETEGRSRSVKLKLFKTPRRARKRDFRGRTLKELPLRRDTVIIDLRAHELVDVELLDAD
jgi:alpha-mannosidase